MGMLVPLNKMSVNRREKEKQQMAVLPFLSPTNA